MREINFAVLFTPKYNDKAVGEAIVEFFGTVVGAHLEFEESFSPVLRIHAVRGRFAFGSHPL